MDILILSLDSPKCGYSNVKLNLSLGVCGSQKGSYWEIRLGKEEVKRKEHDT